MKTIFGREASVIFSLSLSEFLHEEKPIDNKKKEHKNL
jgi:hypothetical protein